jgi:beta-aspartyl-peptidase (threonine type)
LVFGELPQVPTWRTSQRRLREVHNVPVATLIVHGGAGRWDPRIPRAEIDAGLDRALETGWRALEDGALSAVVAAVTALEDDPHFNAGIGAVLKADGEVELSAPRSTP